MKSYVIDANVAAKWFLPSATEPLAAEALALLKRHATGDLRFLVPDLFWAELGNVFWKAARLGRWSSSEAQRAAQLALERQFPTMATKPLLEDALEIATNFDRTVYDSLYIALAIAAKADFVTADEKLANAVAAQFPVKWLGALI